MGSNDNVFFQVLWWYHVYFGVSPEPARLKQSTMTWPSSCSFLLQSGVMPVSESGAEAAAWLVEGDSLEAPGDVVSELVGIDKLDPAFFRSYFFQYCL